MIQDYGFRPFLRLSAPMGYEAELDKICQKVSRSSQSPLFKHLHLTLIPHELISQSLNLSDVNLPLGCYQRRTDELGYSKHCIGRGGRASM